MSDVKLIEKVSYKNDTWYFLTGEGYDFIRKFSTLEEAIAYCDSKSFLYEIDLSC